jgi:SAM-dependent methyltransferase
MKPIFMGIKAMLKQAARRAGRLLGASHVLRIPLVRRSLGKLPGARHLLPGANHVTAWDRAHPFDVAHGTDTSGFVPLADLDHPQGARADAIPYAGSQPSIVRAALDALPPLDSFTFVDLGCGKGRPLLVASEFAFRDIVGVELSASLVAIAKHNAELIAQRFPQRTPIRIVRADATRFQFPAGNLVIFMYNPFGDSAIADVAEAVNAAIVDDPDRIVYVVYYNPVAGHRFDAAPLLRRYLAATFPYGTDELGYGPDSDDPVVIWQGGNALAPIDARANARIEIVDPLYRVKLVPG